MKPKSKKHEQQRVRSNRLPFVHIAAQHAHFDFDICLQPLLRTCCSPWTDLPGDHCCSRDSIQCGSHVLIHVVQVRDGQGVTLCAGMAQMRQAHVACIMERRMYSFP